MALPELNLVTDLHSDTTEALPELADVALAEIGDDGYIINLNAFGKAIWGWKEGNKLPSPILTSLRTGKPLALLDRTNGRRVLGTGVQRQQGWLVVGYHEKKPSILKQESSFRTLIENIPPIDHPFIDQAPQGILFLDQNGDIIFSNQQFRDFLQVAPAADITGNAFQIFDSDPELIEMLQKLLVEGTTLPQDRVMLHATSQRPIPLRVNGSAVFDSENTIMGAVITLEPRRELDEPASFITNEASEHPQLAQLKNVFIAMMSHEIRTPLGVMNGFAEILGKELEEYESETGNVLPPQVKEFVGAIHENAQRLLGLVNELFDLSNMRQLTLSPVLLHQTLVPEIEQIRTHLEEKGIRLETEFNASDLTVMSNARRLMQVWKNLLSNAVKFTREGSLTVRTRSEGNRAVIEIEDTGIGISPAHMNRLFTPFFQEDTRLNRQFPGAGLGLALVRLLLDLMNGDISVESEKGSGSIFRVSLPLASGQ